MIVQYFSTKKLRGGRQESNFGGLKNMSFSDLSAFEESLHRESEDSSEAIARVVRGLIDGVLSTSSSVIETARRVPRDVIQAWKNF